MHKIYLDGITRFCETSELSFFKKLGYVEVIEEPKAEEPAKDVKPKAKGTKKGV